MSFKLQEAKAIADRKLEERRKLIDEYQQGDNPIQ